MTSRTPILLSPITGADKWTDDNWVGTTGIPHLDPLNRPHPNFDGTDSGGLGGG